MTREEELRKIFTKYNVPTSNPFFMAINALEQEPCEDSCEDCISRRDALEVLEYSDCVKSWSFEDNALLLFADDVEKNIRELPSVHPKTEQENILDKIKAEISENANRLKDSLYGDGLRHSLEIIEKYEMERDTDIDTLDTDIDTLDYKGE